MKTILMRVCLLLLFVFAVSCNSLPIPKCDPALLEQKSAANPQEAVKIALNKVACHAPYVNVNNIEDRNYNWRQEIADSPTTLVWCTSSFPSESSPMFTIAVIGKISSSDKRPYAMVYKENHPTDKNDKTWLWHPEVAQPDGMFGTSGEYRYGFGPAGKAEYYDFFDLPTFCTTEPKAWQRQNTIIVAASDPALVAGHERAQQLLSQGKTQEAQKALEETIRSIGGQ